MDDIIDDIFNDFIKECDTGNVESVREFLDTHPNLVNYRRYGTHLLEYMFFFCVDNRDMTTDKIIKIIQLLLERGLNTIYDDNGLNILQLFIEKHYAIDECYMSIMETLIDGGIDINYEVLYNDRTYKNALLLLIDHLVDKDKFDPFDYEHHSYLRFMVEKYPTQEYQNAYLCIRMITNAMMDAEKKKYKAKLKAELAKQKEQLLEEIYAPNGVGYQAAKERFETE